MLTFSAKKCLLSRKKLPCCMDGNRDGNRKNGLKQGKVAEVAEVAIVLYKLLKKIINIKRII